MNLFVSCSCTLTSKHRLWLMSWRRNRTSFVFLDLRVSPIWRVLLVWLWWKHRLGGFQSPWTFHLGLSYRFLVSFVRVVPPRFYLLPSYFFLCVLPKRHMLSVYFSLSLTRLLIIDLAWHLSFPWSSPFFILLKTKYLKSPSTHAVYVRRLDPSVLDFSLSFHRHLLICVPFNSRLISCS